jgi:flagellar biosynthesis/type III secretory pathway M-ring protein FliF/YscJ
LQDLAVLTPSLIVCVAFLAGVFALLRHEMAPRRRAREDESPAEDMTADGPISAQEEAGAAATSESEDAGDRPTGRRSPGQAR